MAQFFKNLRLLVSVLAMNAACFMLSFALAFFYKRGTGVDGSIAMVFGSCVYTFVATSANLFVVLKRVEIR